MENQTSHDKSQAPTATEATADVPEESVAVDDLLEDVSIDGMCGVY